MTQKSHYLACTMRKPYFKDTCTPIFIAALFKIGRTWKPPKCPSTEEWIKMWYIYKMEYYSVKNKNEIESFVERWMGLESIIQSKVIKRRTNMVYLHLYLYIYMYMESRKRYR